MEYAPAWLNDDPLSWLLEPDDANPGVRYFALRDLLGRLPNDPDVVAAQERVMQTGPVPAILAAQAPEGYWVKPGGGYSPKYRGTLWQLLFLSQLGADGRDERVRRAALYVYAHAQTEAGAISYNGRPRGVFHCLWGNVVRALLDLGYWGDAELVRSVDALARSIIGEGYEFDRQGYLKPALGCEANGGLPCAWGTVRALWALAGVLPANQTPTVRAAIQTAADFLLRYDIARADYPHDHRISEGWFKLGFPLAYVTDILLNLEALAQAGYGHDPRLSEALRWVLFKQDERGRWKLEHGYKGQMWVDIEKKGKPSKWVTLRALRTLRRLGWQGVAS